MSLRSNAFVLLLLLGLLPPGEGRAAVDYRQEDRFFAALELARLGDADSQYEVGNRYLRGRGVHVDTAKAVKWLAMAVGQGQKRAQYKLGLLYMHGRGVDRDLRRAWSLFDASAGQGYAPAMFYLGQMLALGLGVEQDKRQAVKWLAGAWQQGFRPPEAEIEKIRQAIDVPLAERP